MAIFHDLINLEDLTRYDSKIKEHISTQIKGGASDIDDLKGRVETLEENAVRVVDLGKCGAGDKDDVTWTLYSTGVLFISGNGAIDNYNYIIVEDYLPYNEAPWYKYKNQIKGVTVKDGITSIGSMSFYNMPLQYINMPNSVTDIGQDGFGGCDTLNNAYYYEASSEKAVNVLIDNGNEPFINATKHYGEIYDPGFGCAVKTKADCKTQIITSEDESPSITMNHNTETRFGFVSEITLALPEDIPEDYISSVVFTSVEESPVNLVYPETIYMTGEGCINGVFVPQSNMRYTIILSYDGQCISGVVGGVPV